MKNKILKNYLITCGAAAVIMIAVTAVDAGNIGLAGNGLRVASDACFVSGMLIMILAVLALVANEGGFHPFGYLRKRLQYTFTGNKDCLMSYTDYVLSQKRKGKLNLTHMFVVGGGLVIASLLFALPSVI